MGYSDPHRAAYDAGWLAPAGAAPEPERVALSLARAVRWPVKAVPEPDPPPPGMGADRFRTANGLCSRTNPRRSFASADIRSLALQWLRSPCHPESRSIRAEWEHPSAALGQLRLPVPASA